MPETPHAELPFERLGDYTVLAPISEGGMASVWLGCATEEPNRFAALKVIRAEHGRNKDFVAMFLDEARIASRLSHPNIIAIHGLGHDGKRHFLAMEVLRGRTLLEVWERAHAEKRRLPYEVVAWIGARVADALHHAHELRDERGRPLHVIHRDVSPSNIFLTDEGVPKLIDFGLAKARDRIASTAIGVIKGKLAYLAPEQVLGHNADRRADIFALGVTLWEVSLDRRLFRRETDVETVRRVRDAEVPDPRSLAPDYPVALAEALARALAKDPAARFQTAAGLRDALDAFVQGSGKPVDEAKMQAIAAELFDGTARASWEKLLDDATAHPDRIRVWDDDGQKMTWMNASIASSEPGSLGDDATTLHVAQGALGNRRDRLDAAIGERLSAEGTDQVTVARAWLERALVDELLGDAANAVEYAEAAVAASATGQAHAMLRRLGHLQTGDGRALAPTALVAHLDAELADTTSDAARADLLAERARLVDVAGDVRASRTAWERALEVRPDHPAALKGLEAALTLDASATAALADHLARMSDAYDGEPRLAAWLQVERADLLDRRLGQPDAAKAALLRGLERDRGIGPVRASCVRHAMAYRDAAWLVGLLAEEASLEGDPARAAALEVDAACVARRRLGDAESAVALLEGAAARMPIAPEVHRRALDELLALHEGAGRTQGDALRVRRIRLTHMDDARARAHEHRAIAALEEALGNPAAGFAALERAVELSPDDATLIHDLDRRLEAASLAEKRIDLWTRFAAATSHGPERARRLQRAASLAAGQGKRAKAVELARAAIVADPGDASAVDRLLVWLESSPPEAMAAEAHQRIAAHMHGAEHAADGARRVAHLEAIAVLQEEMLGDSRAATATYESILRADPERRAAFVGLARAAARAGDGGRLVQALLGEAAQTDDAGAADALRVRAAEACAGFDAWSDALGLVCAACSLARRITPRLGASSNGSTRRPRGGPRSTRRLRPASSTHVTIARRSTSRAGARRAAAHAPPGPEGRHRVPFAARAQTVDPHHPAAREALAGQLEALGDTALLREGFEELASTAQSGEESGAMSMVRSAARRDRRARPLRRRPRRRAPLRARSHRPSREHVARGARRCASS